ncbi:MAG TPA: hypothetical protein VFE08_14545 [Candidatus Sulfotelmatobacter sp.]|jgi:hypothetical protein|nr:hypothetical protein [Candidatus Sulfotelmatobacter sp.]
MIYWQLRLEFNPPEHEDTSEYFPCGDACAAYTELLREWHVSEEDLEDGEITREKDTLIIHEEILDTLTGIISWTLMYTSPKRIELTRTDG